MAPTLLALRSWLSSRLEGNDPLDLDFEGGEQIAESRERVRQGLERRDRAASLVLGIVFVWATIAVHYAFPSHRHVSLPTAALLMVAYFLVSRIEFEVGIGTVIPTQIVFVPMLFLLPVWSVPLLIALVYLASDLVDWRRGEAHLERWVIGLTNSWYTLGPVLVLGAAGEPAPSWRDWPLYLGALGAQFGIEFLAGVRGWFAFHLPPWNQLASMTWAALLDATLAPIGFRAALASVQSRYAFLVILPFTAMLAFLARERRLRIDHVLELGRAYRGTAILLGDVVEADDAYTGAHSRDVVSLVLGVCKRLNVSPREQRYAEFVALLHDVGKIHVPSEIINKPGPLDREERQVIEQHTLEGERLLAGVGGLLGEVGTFVRSCHEHYDGNGYPDGLAGEEIPLIARVVCCCDAFSAMTTNRSYRAAMTTEEAIEELRAYAGTQFDPRVVEVLVAIIEEGELEREEVAVPKSAPAVQLAH